MENMSLVEFWAPLTNFILFVLLLVFFTKGIVKNFAKNRRSKFIEEMESAQKAKREAEAKLAELNSEYSSLDATIASIKETAVVEAKKEAEKIVQSAKILVENTKEEVKRAAATEVSLAKAQLRREILAEVEKSVKGRLRQEFTPEMAKSFVANQVTKLDTLNQ